MYNIFTENQTSKGFVLKQGVSEDRAKRAFERIISALNSKGATLLSAKTLLVVNELQNIFQPTNDFCDALKEFSDLGTNRLRLFPNTEYAQNNIIEKMVDIIMDLKTAVIKEPAIINKEIVLNNKEQKTVHDKRVFIVHGHDCEMKETIARFVEKMGLEAVILHEQANNGKTIIEKFEENSDVSFAIILMSPDDLGKQKCAVDLNPRARQNVIFELGYFMGKLGRSKVCALVKDSVEKPSDIAGVLYIDFNNGWKLELAKELKTSGFEIDMNKVF